MTRFEFTEEQKELRAVVRDVMRTRSSIPRVRDLIDSDDGHDAELWSGLAKELDVIGIDIPEEFGGAGSGAVELGILLEESGRALACIPLLSTVVLAAGALQLSGDAEAQAAFLPSIADGTMLATLAFIDLAVDGEVRPTQADQSDDGTWTLTGTKMFVIDGHLADLLVISAETDAGTALFTVTSTTAGVTRTPMRTLDLTRRQTRLDLDAVSARLLVRSDAGADVLADTLDRARVLLAVEQVGGAEVCLDMSVEYAKIREQFGRPIGSFQAIKHRCADMLVELELAKSVAYDAMWALAEGDDIRLPASMAKAMASDAYVFVATENIQVHGGIGFSWEHPAHLYFRRARSTAVTFGDATQHREIIAAQLGV